MAAKVCAIHYDVLLTAGLEELAGDDDYAYVTVGSNGEALFYVVPDVSPEEKYRISNYTTVPPADVEEDGYNYICVPADVEEDGYNYICVQSNGGKMARVKTRTPGAEVPPAQRRTADTPAAATPAAARRSAIADEADDEETEKSLVGDFLFRRGVKCTITAVVSEPEPMIRFKLPEPDAKGQTAYRMKMSEAEFRSTHTIKRGVWTEVVQEPADPELVGKIVSCALDREYYFFRIESVVEKYFFRIVSMPSGKVGKVGAAQLGKLVKADGKYYSIDPAIVSLEEPEFDD